MKASNTITTINTIINLRELIDVTTRIKKDKKELKKLKKSFYRLFKTNEDIIILEAYRNKKFDLNKLSLNQQKILTLDQEITEKNNSLRKNYGSLAQKIHNFSLCVLSLASAILLLTPAAPIGATILSSIAIYAILEKNNLNPFKKLFKIIFGNPFGKKDHHSSIKKIKSKLKKLQKENVNTDNSKYNIHFLLNSSEDIPQVEEKEIIDLIFNTTNPSSKSHKKEHKKHHKLHYCRLFKKNVTNDKNYQSIRKSALKV